MVPNRVATSGYNRGHREKQRPFSKAREKKELTGHQIPPKSGWLARAKGGNGLGEGPRVLEELQQVANMSTMVEDLSKVAQVLKGSVVAGAGVRGDWEGGVKALLVFSKKGMACGEAHGSGADRPVATVLVGPDSWARLAIRSFRSFKVGHSPYLHSTRSLVWFAIEWLDAESLVDHVGAMKRVVDLSHLEDGVLEPILTFSLGYGVLFILSALLLWSLISDQELSSFKCCLVKRLQWTQH
ncbi:hypothetical protein B0F90DRAFT_1669811 [Multifurca ochricompacta]|uniref:Uncharacterized protein n=1 Tax=Multifurca ochricompacta TaxID=376703 RepID=A0AAD4M034_9AGAM|nr:hypothetical protein B0F90DRAFT_1669811 [Multifurca ochricompacta]